jgi:hypothetical protein
MNEHDDYYEVMFLIPKTGNRFLLQNVQINIENKVETITTKSEMGFTQKIPKQNYLIVEIRVYIPTMKEVRDLVKQTQGENIFLHFKDVHPNLIKGWIVSVDLEIDEAIINFIGNSTNKTYIDYVTEVANQLNAKQEVWDGKEPEYELEPAPKKKVQIYKRKLTF